MIIHAKRANIFMALETTPGTAIADATLFTAANILVQGHDASFEWKPDVVKRNPESRSLQSIASVFGQLPGFCKFKSRTYANGAAGVALGYALMLKSCYCSDTLAASTSETFAQSPDQQTFVTLGFEKLTEDGTVAQRYVLKGVRGTAKLTAGKIGAPFFWAWEFQGAYVKTGGATTTPIATYTFQNEVANGIKFGQFQSPSGIFLRQCDSFELDFGNKINMATDTVDPSYLLYGTLESQEPTLKLGYRAVTKSVADDVLNFVNGALIGASSVTFGTTAGQILTFATGDSAQVESLSEKAIGAAMGFEVTIGLHRTATAAADNGFSLVFA